MSIDYGDGRPDIRVETCKDAARAMRLAAKMPGMSGRRRAAPEQVRAVSRFLEERGNEYAMRWNTCACIATDYIVTAFTSTSHRYSSDASIGAEVFHAMSSAASWMAYGDADALLCHGIRALGYPRFNWNALRR